LYNILVGFVKYFTSARRFIMENLGALTPILVVLIVLFLIMLSSIKQISEYERGILFNFGKFRKILGPGWHVVWPIFQSYSKIDIRTKVVDVPEQEAITKDNVSVKINAVLYYKIFNASNAVIAVENYNYAVSQLAQTTMRNIVGSVKLDELLSERDAISKNMCEILDVATDPWGIKVENVELKDISLPEEMKRVIAKVAEAEREKQAVITKASGEVEASNNLARAATTMAAAPGALHLRTLATLNDLSSDQSNTVIFAIPIEGLEALKGISDLGKAKAKDAENK
jgi:regulator of protease activity HflC (stomatin/prohibitin superfamily)